MRIVFIILLLLFPGVSLWAQATTVRGTVTNEAGETLPGVNVAHITYNTLVSIGTNGVNSQSRHYRR